MRRLMGLKMWLESGHARKVLNLTLSVLGTVGLCRLCGIADRADVLPFNTFLFMVLTVVFYIVYDKSPAVKKGGRALAMVMAGLLAIVMVIGRQLDTRSWIVWSLGTVVTIVGMGCVFYGVMKYVVDFCGRFWLRGDFVLTRRQKWLIFGAILLGNTMIFLAVFPGVYGWDASYQAYTFLRNAVTSHYSVLMTGVFGGLLGIGRDLFGSIEVGMVIAMVLQMIFMSFVYAQVVFFVGEYARKKWAVVGAVVFFMLNLIMGLMTVYATQDVVFGGIFALIFMELFRLAKDPGYWSKKLNVAKFIILAFLLCATRNNGMYVLCLVFVAGIFVSTRRKRDLVILAAPIVLALLYTGPIFNLLKIQNVDSVREMMSIPSQQLARVYVFNSDGITVEEKEKIESYYEVEGLLKYKTMMAKSDPVKSALDGEKVEENWGDYIGLWLGVGLKNPKVYVEAFLLNSLGFWYPNKEYNDPRAAIPYIEYLPSGLWSEGDGRFVSMKIEQHSLLPGYEHILYRLYGSNDWQKVPIFANLTSIGTYFILFVFLCGMVIYKKRKDFVLPLSLVMGNYLILMLAPVAIFRYCYPIIIVAPIMFVMVFQGRSVDKVKGVRRNKK